MSYAEKFLKSRGKLCSIARTPIVTSYVSMKRSSKSTNNTGIRDAAWEGLILADAGLASGEVFSIGSSEYLVQSVDNDSSSREDIFFCVKTNADLMHKRFVETVDENHNVVQQWQVQVSSVPAFGQIVTANLRQEDPGLLDATKYVFQIPKFSNSISAVALDRMVYDGSNFQVESVDNTGLRGISRVQLSTDTRPD